MSETLAASVAADVPEVFRTLPAGWVYATASGEEQDRFNRAIGELLADEHYVGATATARIEMAIVGARANIIRSWLGDARRRLQDIIAAEQFLAAHPAAEVEREQQAAVVELAAASDELVKAQARYTEAAERSRQAELLLRRREEAEQAVRPGDPVLAAAWARYQKLRAQQAAAQEKST